MSDLIHEGPKDPNKPPVPGEEKPTTERERMKKVYTYVAILFTVAFLLILWTFLMNQRSINEIKDGNTALQSTLQQNDSLEAHIAELEEQLANSETCRSPRTSGCCLSRRRDRRCCRRFRSQAASRARAAGWTEGRQSRRALFCPPRCWRAALQVRQCALPESRSAALWTSCFRTA